MLISLRDICIHQIRALLQIHLTKSTSKYIFLLKVDFQYNSETGKAAIIIKVSQFFRGLSVKIAHLLKRVKTKIGISNVLDIIHDCLHV